MSVQIMIKLHNIFWNESRSSSSWTPRDTDWVIVTHVEATETCLHWLGIKSQGWLYLIARQPGASKITSWASGYEQNFPVNSTYNKKE